MSNLIGEFLSKNELRKKIKELQEQLEQKDKKIEELNSPVIESEWQKLKARSEKLEQYKELALDKTVEQNLLDQLSAAKSEADSLATSMHKRHYSDVTQWGLCDTPAAVITQIDNMVAGLNEKLSAKDEEIERLTLFTDEVLLLNAEKSGEQASEITELQTRNALLEKEGENVLEVIVQAKAYKDAINSRISLGVVNVIREQFFKALNQLNEVDDE